MTDSEIAAIIAAFKDFGLVPNNDQAMALVKQIKLDIVFDGLWTIGKSNTFDNPPVAYKDLNRAIVMCVANMQAAKSDATV